MHKPSALLLSILHDMTLAKQRKIGRAAAIFLQRHKQYQACDCRFDVIACTQLSNGKYDFDWIEAAFYAA